MELGQSPVAGLKQYDKGWADQFYALYPAGTELLTDTTKLHLETASKLKSEVRLSTASWRNTSSVKGSRHMLIMRYDAHMHAYDA
ncbi:unnamed protein product [Sphenostylis stenocarpa]|uniref:Uncharacterized protein n=1 Tax=Sphenostylis stenocarpa TaxID=92480 RepID=A0AA86VXZ7_9FABA|nr:unnamed protein product [Sphenostylis stenocarpa]